MIKKLMCGVCILVSIFLICVMAGCSVAEGTPEPQNTTYSDYSTTKENRVGMEKMGSAGNFVYYRDTSTDVMYLWRCEKGYNAGYGGLTVMMNPETGKPLTYADWVEFEEGEYNGSDENTKSGD